jgi:hypothetical protein
LKDYSKFEEKITEAEILLSQQEQNWTSLIIPKNNFQYINCFYLYVFHLNIL